MEAEENMCRYQKLVALDALGGRLQKEKEKEKKQNSSGSNMSVALYFDCTRYSISFCSVIDLH